MDTEEIPIHFDSEEIKEKCRRQCRCFEDQGPRRKSRYKNYNEYDDEQRTFISFLTEVVSVMAFIFFGSVVFWLAVGGVLFDFFKKLYYSDRYVKLFITGIFAFLVLSMMVRQYMNKRAFRAQVRREQIEAAKAKAKAIPQPDPPKLLPEFLRIELKDKKLQDLKSGGDGRSITKKFTLTIVDEKKKEVFRTSKIISIPEMAMEMKKPPALIFYLKEIILDNY